jgi:hypothetical protein
MNRLAEAEPLMKRASLVFLSSFGVQHPNTTTVRNNYALLPMQMWFSHEQTVAKLNELCR